MGTTESQGKRGEVGLSLWGICIILGRSRRLGEMEQPVKGLLCKLEELSLIPRQVKAGHGCSCCNSSTRGEEAGRTLGLAGHAANPTWQVPGQQKNISKNKVDGSKGLKQSMVISSSPPHMYTYVHALTPTCTETQTCTCAYTPTKRQEKPPCRDSRSPRQSESEPLVDRWK